MTKGIVIYSFKKTSYGKMAFNLAVSIKANSPDIPICLIHDDLALAHLSEFHLKFFDQKVMIDREDLYDDRKFSPGKAKIRGYKYFPFDHTMVIDADTVCILPVEPLFEQHKTKPIYSQTTGTWTEEAEHWTCQWLPLSLCKQVFDLPKTYRLYEINSSFMLVKKGKEAEGFYDQAYQNYLKANGHPKLGKWGGTFPDELALNIAFAQTGLSPNFDDLKTEDITNVIQKPVFFSFVEAYKPKKHGPGYYFLGCFGGRNNTSHSLQDQCDTYMRCYAAKFDYLHEWKYHLLMRHKHYGEK